MCKRPNRYHDCIGYHLLCYTLTNGNTPLEGEWENMETHLLFNPPQHYGLSAAGYCLTKVAAGTDFIRKSIEAFAPGTCKARVLVDVLAYDGAPALAALEDAGTKLE